MVNADLIAGLPAIAPSLALSVYFAHFTGASESAVNMYPCFFATPANYQNATAIGYMGYLIMAVILALLIKYLKYLFLSFVHLSYLLLFDKMLIFKHFEHLLT